MVPRAELALLGLACFASTALAAIHPYNKEYFYAVGDAFIFRGGREGLYSSTKEVCVMHGLPFGKSYDLDEYRSRDKMIAC